MSPAPALASIGDHGVLNTSLSESLSSIWLDRDLSWLDFNERVLAEALDERTPLLERAKFLAIFTSNLDEFFMKRMVTVRGGSSAQQRDLRERLRAKLLASLRLQAECSRNSITPGLAKHGSALRRWDELTSAQQREAGDYFDASLSPALTPLVIDLAGFPSDGFGQRRTHVRAREDPRGAQELGAADGRDGIGSEAFRAAL